MSQPLPRPLPRPPPPVTKGRRFVEASSVGSGTLSKEDSPSNRTEEQVSAVYTQPTSSSSSSSVAASTLVAPSAAAAVSQKPAQQVQEPDKQVLHVPVGQQGGEAANEGEIMPPPSFIPKRSNATATPEQLDEANALAIGTTAYAAENNSSNDNTANPDSRSATAAVNTSTETANGNIMGQPCMHVHVALHELYTCITGGQLVHVTSARAT